MSRRRKGNPIHGVLLLDKPVGFSSNQAVQKVRWLFQARKAGHTGSLDPFATGMLPICLGEASKTAGFMLESVKTYQAIAQLGVATETGDTEGEEINFMTVPELTTDDINRCFSGFLGQIDQVPPMYSALKYQGEPLYKLARQGIKVDRPSRPVTIHELELVSWDAPLLEFRVVCSKGTYIRTLAEDLSEALGTCAHLRALRRLAVGVFDRQKMITLDELELAVQENRQTDFLLPVDSGLSEWPVVTIDADGSTRFLHGNPVADMGPAQPSVRVYGPEDQLLGLGEIRANHALYPNRVFVW